MAAREVHLNATSGRGIDDAVMTEVASACAGLGGVPYMRIKERHVGQPHGPAADAKVRLLVGFVLDDRVGPTPHREQT